MKITFYGYNTFIIESGDKKIAIDPGGLFLYYFKLNSLIPRSEWSSITHLFITHGDPDHYWHADRVAEASHAPIICNKSMLKDTNGQALMLGPRAKGLKFTASMKNVHTLSVDETIELDGMRITGLKATHGPLTLKFGPFSKTVTPGPKERIGWGAIGFRIELDGKCIVNLGDTLLHATDWASINHPDVLMIPIGGREVHNTMDENEALEVVGLMQPSVVIPCHYNLPVLFDNKYCPADDVMFKQEAEKFGTKCVIMNAHESVEV